jgi:hypothetical protein
MCRALNDFITEHGADAPSGGLMTSVAKLDRINRRAFMALVLASGSALTLAGCGLFNPFAPSATLRYRTTVEIETPQGVKSGSSVTELKRIEKGSFGDSPMTGGYIKAEAVAVDLPNGRMLFALLRNDKLGADYPVLILSSVFDYPNAPPSLRGPAAGTLAVRMKEAAKQKPGFTLQGTDYPLLVTFTDIRDPKTVTRVDPDDLAASFGVGVKLRRITVQITNDPVTTGIEKRLGWLPTVYERLDRDFQPEGVPVGDFQRLFTTEIEK